MLVGLRRASSLFLFCFRSLARRFWNQIFTCKHHTKNRTASYCEEEGEVEEAEEEEGEVEEAEEEE
jgi:hypothetical protein